MGRNRPGLHEIHTIVFDFDGVFTNNKVYLNEHGEEFVRCDRGDGLGIDLLRAAIRKGRLNAQCFILSKETNGVVMARAKKLKIDCTHAVANKLDYLKKHLSERFPEEKNASKGLVYLGNDINDLAAMQFAGYSVAPVDAHPSVKAIADLVLPEKGGDGFVRAFVEQLLNIGELTTGGLCELISDS